MSVPAVSVLIPTYNRASFLAKTIAVVLNQTFTDFELIVVNDASTDDTADVLKKLKALDPRIVVVDHAGRHGAAAARNAGLRASKSEWIAFLDSDDAWERNKLEQFMNAVTHDAVLVGSDYVMVDDHAGSRQTMLQFVREVMLPWWKGDVYAGRIIDCDDLLSETRALTDPQTIIGMTIGGFLWPHTSSTMVRRSSVMKVGGFDERLCRTEDMDLWLKLMQVGRFVYINQVLGQYNIGGREAATGERYEKIEAKRRHDSFVEARYHLRFARHIPRRFDLNSDQRKFLRERVASHHRMCGFAARGYRPFSALWHYSCSLVQSASQRRQFRRNRKRFFENPW